MEKFEQHNIESKRPEMTEADIRRVVQDAMYSYQRVMRLGAGADIIQLDPRVGFNIGATTFAASPFRVTMQGALTTANIDIGVTNLTIDSTGDIQTAIDTLNAAGGGVLHLKAGTYTVTSPIALYSGVRLDGESASTTTINFSSGANNITMTGTNVYTTGTISSISGGVNVVGSGTTWTSAMVGRQIFITNRWYVISGFTDTTHITLASGYADGPTYSGTYRIASVIKDVEILNLTLTASTTTAIVGTDVRDLLLQDLTIASNNKGFALTNFMNIAPIRVLVSSSTSNGYEMTNGSFGSLESCPTVSNGGHGAVLNSISSCSFFLCAANSNTSDGYNCTDTDKCLISTEAAGNGGQGIEFVSGCDDNLIDDELIISNTSDGIKFTATSDRNTISSAIIASNGGYGINIAASTCDGNIIITPSFSSNSSGNINDSGTGTLYSVTSGNPVTGTSSAGAITLNGRQGIVTTEALTTAAGSSYTLTLTNSAILATSNVICAVSFGTATAGIPLLYSSVPAGGSCVFKVLNVNATGAASFDGTLKFFFLVL